MASSGCSFSTSPEACLLLSSVTGGSNTHATSASQMNFIAPAVGSVAWRHISIPLHRILLPIQCRQSEKSSAASPTSTRTRTRTRTVLYSTHTRAGGCRVCIKCFALRGAWIFLYVCKYKLLDHFRRFQAQLVRSLRLLCTSRKLD